MYSSFNNQTVNISANRIKNRNMQDLVLLSLIFCSINLLSINGQDSQNINKSSKLINNKNTNCTCVPYYLCEHETTSNGITEIPRFVDESCEDHLHVCCKKKQQHKINNLPPPSGINKSKGCGIRNPNGIGFAVQSNVESNVTSEAKFGEFPWMVAVLRNKTEKLLTFQCGASLIHPQVVLTSAYCVYSENTNLSVRAGEWDTKTKDELLPYQDVKVKNIVIHPNFNAKTLQNDVALLILEVPLEIVENVDTVCLPPQNEVLGNVNCFYSSWYKNIFQKKGITHNILSKGEVPIIENGICQERLRRISLGKSFVLDDSFICSGSEGACEVSGGSPLVCLIPGETNKYYQSGIVAWGIVCEKTPLVYSNVGALRNWIDNEMLILSYDISTYTY